MQTAWSHAHGDTPFTEARTPAIGGLREGSRDASRVSFRLLPNRRSRVPGAYALLFRCDKPRSAVPRISGRSRPPRSFGPEDRRREVARTPTMGACTRSWRSHLPGSDSDRRG